MTACTSKLISAREKNFGKQASIGDKKNPSPIPPETKEKD
jgi:hypothetical protein